MGDSLAAIGRDLRRNAATLGGLTALLWLVQVLNVTVFHGSLIRWGIQPRTVQGLPGILVHPFLHAGWQHLISNTIGFLMLGGMVMLREPRDFWIVSGLSLIIGGVGIWLFGRPGPHIGASGVVFGYFGYLLLTGWFDRRVGPIILSILTLLLWGRLLFGLSPFQRGISWEGHLFGLLGGILAAWLRPGTRRNRRRARLVLGIAALSIAAPLHAQKARAPAPTLLPVLYMPDGGMGEDVLPGTGSLRYLHRFRPESLVECSSTRRAGVRPAEPPTGLTWHFEPMLEESHATIYHPAALRAVRRLFAPPSRRQ